MTHINPDGKAVGGEQPTKMSLLHIYSQLHEHGEARIVGNQRGIEALLYALGNALAKGGKSETMELFASDGEGYQVEVKILPDDWNDPEWEKEENQVHYCWRGYSDDVNLIVERTIWDLINRGIIKGAK